MSRRDREEAAAVLRRLLYAVDTGEMTAAGLAGARLVRRLEGAISALEAEGTG